MTNQISKADYEEIKNALVDVVVFDPVTMRRTSTYGGLSYKEAIEYVTKQQAVGAICMIVNNQYYDRMGDGPKEDGGERMTLQELSAFLKSENNAIPHEYFIAGYYSRKTRQKAKQAGGL